MAGENVEVLNEDVLLTVEDVCPEVYTIDDITMNDRINFYAHEIFHGVGSGGIEGAFVAYVVSNVEPVGWKAIWRSTTISSGLKIGYDFIVEVRDVSQVALKADVRIKSLLAPVADDNLNEVKKFVTIPLHEAPLSELFTVFEPENNDDFEKTAFAVDTVRFFYDYIWRPWDDDDDDDHDFVDRHLKHRIKLYYDMKSGIISRSNSEKIIELLHEAKEVHFEIQKLQQEMNADDVNSDLKDSDVLNCYLLNQKLDDIRKKLQILENPVLNTLINQEEFSLKNNIRGQRSNGEKVIHLVASKFIAANLISHLGTLASDATVEFHQSLNKAISGCYEGDTILVFPGIYSCEELTWLDESIALRGLGTRANETVIKSAGNGDIFINCEANSLTLANLKLEFNANVTCGLVVHRGKTILENCEVSGSQIAVCVISGAQVKISDCKIQDASVTGIELRTGSSIYLSKSSIKGCGVAAIALQLCESKENENRITATIEDSFISENEKYGLVLTLGQFSLRDSSLKFETENFKAIKRFPQHNLEITKNVFEKNKIGDVAVVKSNCEEKDIE